MGPEGRISQHSLNIDRAYVFGRFRLAPSQQLLMRSGEPVKLGGRALDLLILLVIRAGEVVSKEELVAHAWPNVLVSEHNLKMQIRNLRRALGDRSSHAEYVATVVGQGYKFIGRVKSEQKDIARFEDDQVGIEYNLPAVRRLVGRQHDVDRVARLLDVTRLVTLIGPGGVGKTSLAVVAAHARHGMFPDGIRFADLAMTQDPALIPHVVARCLGIRGDPTDVISAVAEHLRYRRMLIILDNCEHVLPAAANIAYRLVKAETCSCLLATSREPLGVSGEKLVRVKPLAYPTSEHSIKAHEAIEYSAVELVAVLALERANYEFLDGDAASVSGLCKLLDGLPLAIEIAAAKLVDFSPSELLSSISRRLLELRNDKAEVHPRHQTVWATLDWSYRLLSADEGSLFRLLAVFAGPFSSADVAYMARLLDYDPYQTTVTLAAIVSKSLASAEADDQGVHYRLLESVRHYASEALMRDALQWRAQQQHARLVLEAFERSLVEWPWMDSKTWRQRYVSRSADLRRALDWCFGPGGDVMIGVNLAAASIRFWNEQSSISEQLLQVERALAHCSSMPADALRRAKLAESLAFTMTLARKSHADTKEAWNTAIRFAKKSGDAGRLLAAMFGKANFLIYSGRNEECLNLLDEFKTIATAENDPGALHDCRRLASLARIHLGELEAARNNLESLAEEYKRGVAPSRTARYQLERYVSIFGALAFSTWLTGDCERGLEQADIMITHLESADHPRGQSNVLALVALPLALWSGNIEMLDRYVANLRRNLDRENIWLWEPVHRFYASALRYQRGIPNATDAMRLAIEELVGDAILVRTPMYQGWLADALLHKGKAIDASVAIELALELQRRSGEAWCLPELLRIKASVILTLGRREEAQALLESTYSHAEKTAARTFQLRVLKDLKLMVEQIGPSSLPGAVLPAYRDINEQDGTSQPL